MLKIWTIITFLNYPATSTIYIMKLIVYLINTYVNHFIDDNPMIFVIIYGLEDYSHIMSLFTFSIIWPCVLDLFEYQILSTTFHYVFNESCRDSLFIVIANWIHVSDLAYEMMLYKKEQYTKSLYFV